MFIINYNCEVETKENDIIIDTISNVDQQIVVVEDELVDAGLFSSCFEVEQTYNNNFEEFNNRIGNFFMDKIGSTEAAKVFERLGSDRQLWPNVNISLFEIKFVQSMGYA